MKIPLRSRTYRNKVQVLLIYRSHIHSFVIRTFTEIAYCAILASPYGVALQGIPYTRSLRYLCRQRRRNRMKM